MTFFNKKSLSNSKFIPDKNEIIKPSKNGIISDINKNPIYVDERTKYIKTPFNPYEDAQELNKHITTNKPVYKPLIMGGDVNSIPPQYREEWKRLYGNKNNIESIEK